MAKIFVSYARADATQLADDLADNLRALEYDVFLDKHSIVGSTEWEKVIRERVRWCDVMVILVTPASNQSQWVFREFEFAKIQKKNILPVIVNQTPLPVHLGKYHAVEYVNNNLDAVLLQITRITPPPKSKGFSRRTISFTVVTTLVALILAFLALVPENRREQWFCRFDNSCATEDVQTNTDTPEPESTDETSSENDGVIVLSADTPVSTDTATVSPEPTHTPAPTNTPIPIYEEDFEDGEAQGWAGLIGSSWEIVRNEQEANSMLYKPISAYRRVLYLPSRDWDDVVIGFQAIVPSSLHIYLCNNDNFVVHIDEDSNYLSFRNLNAGNDIQSVSIPLLESEWMDIRIELRGNRVTAFIGTIRTTVYTPTVSSPCNERELGIATEGTAIIDNIRVWGLDD